MLLFILIIEVNDDLIPAHITKMAFQTDSFSASSSSIVASSQTDIAFSSLFCISAYLDSVFSCASPAAINASISANPLSEISDFRLRSFHSLAQTPQHLLPLTLLGVRNLSFLELPECLDHRTNPHFQPCRCPRFLTALCRADSRCSCSGGSHIFHRGSHAHVLLRTHIYLLHKSVKEITVMADHNHRTVEIPYGIF